MTFRERKGPVPKRFGGKGLQRGGEAQENKEAGPHGAGKGKFGERCINPTSMPILLSESEVPIPSVSDHFKLQGLV